MPKSNFQSHDTPHSGQRSKCEITFYQTKFAGTNRCILGPGSVEEEYYIIPLLRVIYFSCGTWIINFFTTTQIYLKDYSCWFFFFFLSHWNILQLSFSKYGWIKQFGYRKPYNYLLLRNTITLMKHTKFLNVNET